MAAQAHRWVVYKDLIISHTQGGPDPDDVWHAFAKDIVSKGITRCLGTSDGSTEITSVQRKICAEALVKRKIMTAAVTDDRITRGLAVAVSWFGVNLKPFSWSELRRALEFLNIPPGEIDHVTDLAQKLRAGSAQR